MRLYATEKGPTRRPAHCFRSALPAVLFAGVLLPLLFVRAAFLALDAGASVCPSVSCLGWKLGIGAGFSRGSDSAPEFVEEWAKSYAGGAATGGSVDPAMVDSAPDSMDDLITELGSLSTYDHLDIKTFFMRSKAMLLKMDRKVQVARFQALLYRHLASIGIPKSMHCLSLRLAEEYFVNALARSSLPPPEYGSRLTDASYLHIALITDNVLAAAVAISSTLRSSDDPASIVFHVVTDKKTYIPMHAWFALHSVYPAIIEVKGLHQFDWHSQVKAMVMNTIEEISQSFSDYGQYSGIDREYRRLEALKLSAFSLTNYLKIHLPELFPKLEKLIVLDDDVVVHRDLRPLWALNLQGKVIGAVGVQGYKEDGGNLCVDKKLGDYLNFSNPTISLQLLGVNSNQCAWSWGINIFDLKAWRSTNITETYQLWLKKNRESGFALWHTGSLPPALLAFEGHVHALEPWWQISGLGWQVPDSDLMESAAVLHFGGPEKPWLEITNPKVRAIWRAHLNRSDEFLRSCRIVK